MQLRTRMIEMSTELLANPLSVYIDTETTGLSRYDEVVQIACIDWQGQPLYESLIRPINAVLTAEVTRIHGISAEMVVDAPTLSDVFEDLASLLRGKLLIAYNADFDKRMLIQSARANHGCVMQTKCDCSPICQFFGGCDWTDVMKPYASYYAITANQRRIRWQKLVAACEQQGVDSTKIEWHTASGDCFATYQLLKAISLKGAANNVVV